MTGAATFGGTAGGGGSLLLREDFGISLGGAEIWTDGGLGRGGVKGFAGGIWGVDI